MKALSLINGFIMCLITLSLLHCGQTQTRTVEGESSTLNQKANFHLLLTDAPISNISSVIVNVSHAELRLAGQGKEARLIVAENLGPIDLLKLRDGVTLPMASLNIPADTEVSQIRLVLKNEGHSIVRSDESVCILKTPSAERTGIKMIIHQGIKIESGYDYSVVADFDAEKSIVLMGHGGCLLKPVLKLKSATREAPDEVTSLPLTGDNFDAPDGFEEPSPEDEAVPVINLEQLNEYML